MIENLWENDAFSMYNLSNALMTLPVIPGRVGQLGIYTPQGIPTTVAVLENKDGVIALVPNTPRGGQATINPTQKRQVRAYPMTHLVQNDSVLADDVQNIRAFGSETELQEISTVINNRLSQMKTNLEVTREHLRVTSLNGEILDADGTTVIANLFTDFGVTRTTVDFLLGTSTTDVQGKCIAVKRAIELALGSSPYTEIRVLCSNTFFDAFIAHANVKAAYANWQSNEFLRSDPRAGFPFGGLTWENYAPVVGTRKFITEGDALPATIGTANVMKEFIGPADYTETVNTVGREFYAKSQQMEFDAGTKLQTQTNPLPICTRPGILVRIHSSD